MHNVECLICGHVRDEQEQVHEHCPHCDARAMFSRATTRPADPLPELNDDEHGLEFGPGAGPCEQIA
jgi:hypothetical protein